MHYELCSDTVILIWKFKGKVISENCQVEQTNFNDDVDKFNSENWVVEKYLRFKLDLLSITSNYLFELLILKLDISDLFN